MSLLIAGNHLQVAVGSLVQARIDEVLLSVVLHTLRIEGGLEVLQGQGVLEDIN